MVVEWSKSSNNLMRKVVGSNPGDDLYKIVRFSFVEVDRSIEGRKLIWLMKSSKYANTQQCDRNEAKQEVV